MSLTVADRAQLQRWWEESVACGGLPDDVEPVQARLIRVVGRARLPDAGEVYLKVMGFPRPKDRLRYLFRALPAQHEARMLAVLTESGIPCPAVLDARGRRTFGIPRLSFLVLRGLDRVDRQPDGSEIARLAGELAKAGVFHPDLHRGNQLPLVDGRLAVLDLHSARLARPGLSRRQRLIVAARLIGEPGPLAEDCVPLVQAGLLQPEELVLARQLARSN